MLFYDEELTTAPNLVNERDRMGFRVSAFSYYCSRACPFSSISSHIPCIPFAL